MKRNQHSANRGKTAMDFAIRQLSVSSASVPRDPRLFLGKSQKSPRERERERERERVLVSNTKDVMRLRRKHALRPIISIINTVSSLRRKMIVLTAKKLVLADLRWTMLKVRCTATYSRDLQSDILAIENMIRTPTKHIRLLHLYSPVALSLLNTNYR